MCVKERVAGMGDHGNEKLFDDKALLGHGRHGAFTIGIGLVVQAFHMALVLAHAEQFGLGIAEIMFGIEFPIDTLHQHVDLVGLGRSLFDRIVDDVEEFLHGIFQADRGPGVRHVFAGIGHQVIQFIQAQNR